MPRVVPTDRHLFVILEPRSYVESGCAEATLVSCKVTCTAAVDARETAWKRGFLSAHNPELLILASLLNSSKVVYGHGSISLTKEC